MAVKRKEHPQLGKVTEVSKPSPGGWTVRLYRERDGRDRLVREGAGTSKEDAAAKAWAPPARSICSGCGSRHHPWEPHGRSPDFEPSQHRRGRRDT